MSRLIDFMTIIAWNIYVGTSAREARRALREFIVDYLPEVIALMEANNLYGDLNGLGYEVVQLKPRSLRPGNLPGQGNIALLVRDDIEIVRRGALRMRTFWKGPKHGHDQDPRVYRWIKIRHQGRIWKVMAAHTPFGETARRESRNRIVRWLRRTMPGRPTVLVIDSNMSFQDFREDIAWPGEARATGHHIDVAAYKHCQLMDEVNLGKGVSDHPAMKYNFMARRRRRKR